MTKDLGPFENPYMKGIRIVFIMLAPAEGNIKAGNDIMGYISSMLIEDYEFMDVVQKGNKEEIRDMLSKNLKKFFNQYISGI